MLYRLKVYGYGYMVVHSNIIQTNIFSFTLYFCLGGVVIGYRGKCVPFLRQRLPKILFLLFNLIILINHE